MSQHLASPRSSGILAHISSLPSPYGIGDLGPSSYQFLEFLHQSQQRHWQFLPVGPSNPVFDNSPYMSSSAFAGSPLLISPDLLHEEGLISRDTLRASPDFSEYSVDFPAVTTFKKKILTMAFTRFSRTDTEFLAFQDSSPWLDDYALFMALKEEFQGQGWFDWPRDIATRQPEALVAAGIKHRERMTYYAFEQFVFFRQWQMLRRQARQKDIKLIGDIPIFVGWDSVDVWAHQDIFTLNPASLHPTLVAGVPPDYFSATGPRWGNPLYQWQSPDLVVQKKLNDWWKERFKATMAMVDIARIDHFRGFAAYWAIPEQEETAIKGQWLKGPGRPFFETLAAALGPLPIIAEDLGIITSDVIALRDALGFPGMKVLQFAFDDNPANPFLPHNYTSPNCVVYTGTHDNDTTLGWYLGEELTNAQRERIRKTCNQTGINHETIHKDLIYLAMASIANLCIFPLQDILGFGNDCKMNSPGTQQGNWRWRCAPRFLSSSVSSWLREQTVLFSRSPVIWPPSPILNPDQRDQ